MRPQEDRALKIQQVVVERTRTGILSFLGIVRYYQRFVPHLGNLLQPLTPLQLMRKERSVSECGEAQDAAAQAIKDIFQSPDVLVHFNPDPPHSHRVANVCFTLRFGSSRYTVADTNRRVGALGLF